jgi:hypothetical protein
VSLDPPASWSPKSKAHFPNIPAHIQQAVAQRAAEVSKSPARGAMLASYASKKRMDKPRKLVLRPPKSWPSRARQDFSTLPAYVQQDIAADEEAINALVPRAYVVRRRLAAALMAQPAADGLMGLGVTLTGMNHEHSDIAALLPVLRTNRLTR